MKLNHTGMAMQWMSVLLTAACLAAPSTASAETPAEAEVRQAMVEVVSAAARLDAQAIMARLDDDPSCRYFVQGQSFNYPDLAVFLRDSFADMSSQQVVWLESAAREISPDTVLWTSSGRNPVVESSGRALEYLLAETWVWKKSGDAWKAIHYQESFLDMPAPASLAQVESALAAFAGTFKVPSSNPEDLLPVLEGFLLENDVVLGSAFAFAPVPGNERPAAYVYRRNGSFVRKLETFGSGYAQAEWFAKPAASGQLAWSNPYFDTHGAQRMMLTCSMPILDSQGSLQGVLTADLALY